MSSDSNSVPSTVKAQVQAFLLPKDAVLLPGVIIRLPLSSEAADKFEIDGRSLAAARKIIPGLKVSEALLVAVPIDPTTKKPNSVGTFCRLVPDRKIMDTNRDALANGSGRMLQGLCRARILSKPTFKSGKVIKVELIGEDNQRFSIGLVDELKQSVQTLLQRLPAAAPAVARVLALSESARSPAMLIDIFAAVMPLNGAERLELLSELNAGNRCSRLCEILSTKPDKSSDKLIGSSADQKNTDSDKFRNALVKSSAGRVVSTKDPRGSIKTIGSRQKKDDDGLNDIEEKLNEAELSAEGRKVVDRELKRLHRMSAQQAEYQVARTYLETLADIPWNNNQPPLLTKDSIEHTRHCLDEDHYGLERAKKRLVEFVAVSYLRQKKQMETQGSNATNKSASKDDTATAPIILLVGPPGVGKTSLAKSTARALNRALYRVSLGGVRDEAEIRGHRRTYIGAMPGVIVQALRRSGSMNPVLVLDEIDKVSQGVHSAHGDPTAALLEVLDPAQNSSFVDHYIGFPIDLSKITFIATANSTDTIPAPLLDRMEVINIEGYTYLEKDHIARQYLLPKQLKATALEPTELELDPEAMHAIATRYTRESGVRNLERQIGALCRAFAVEMLESNDSEHKKKVIQVEDLKKYLGLEKFYDDVINDKVDEYVTENGELRLRHIHGLVNGLAYMGSGVGGILVFEATKTPGGTGKLQLTGKLGSVISESAYIALSWVRANAKKLGIPVTELKNNDFHLHAPAGAIPKDGPSAGVAMTICFVSLLTGRQVPRDLAMTGEITLRGKILPVGGVREKILGAHLAGVHKVILPYHCQNVVEEECDFVKYLGIEVVYAKYIWDVFTQIWPDDISLSILQHSRI